MYKYIKNPITLKNVSIFSKIGYRVLKSYLNTINQYGGGWIMPDKQIWEMGHIISYNEGFGTLLNIENGIVFLNTLQEGIDISNCINITLNPPNEKKLNTWIMPNKEIWKINDTVLYNGDLGVIFDIRENGYITLLINEQQIVIPYSLCANLLISLRKIMPNEEIWEINHTVICNGNCGLIVSIDKDFNIILKNGEDTFNAHYSHCVNMTLNSLTIENQDIIKTTIYFWSELKKKKKEELYEILKLLNADLTQIDITKPESKGLLLNLIETEYLLDDSVKYLPDLDEINDINLDKLYEIAESYDIDIDLVKTYPDPHNIKLLKDLLKIKIGEDISYGKDKKYILISTTNRSGRLCPIPLPRIKRKTAVHDDEEHDKKYLRHKDLMSGQQQSMNVNIQELNKIKPPVVVVHGHSHHLTLSLENQHKYNILFSTPLYCASWLVDKDLTKILQKCFIRPNLICSPHSIYGLWREDEIGEGLRFKISKLLTENCGRSTGIDLTLGLNQSISSNIDLGAKNTKGEFTENYSAIVIIDQNERKDVTKEVLHELELFYEEQVVGKSMQYLDREGKPITISLKDIENSIKKISGKDPIIISFGCRSVIHQDLLQEQDRAIGADKSKEQDLLEDVSEYNSQNFDKIFSDFNKSESESESYVGTGSQPLVADNIFRQESNMEDL